MVMKVLCIIFSSKIAAELKNDITKAPILPAVLPTGTLAACSMPPT